MKEEKAYRAMVNFLAERYRRSPSDALGQLLGELGPGLWMDGEPADPAVRAEWEEALAHADNQSNQPSVLRRAS